MKAAAAFFALALALLVVTTAHADGEAGLVIQNGDRVETYCVAFTGDSIAGDALLQRAGITVEQFGGSGGRTVCALDDVGCFDAGTFNDCFCQCQGGNCTYWAFFTQKYGGGWVYSAVAFNLARARDGDLHGWKWGRGSLQSAPVPSAITFEQVCGHAPRGGLAPTPTTAPTTAVPATATQSSAPTATTTAAPTQVGTSSPSETTTSPTVATATSSPSATPAPVTITIAPRAITAAAPAAGEPGEDSGGGPPAGLIGFAAAAGVLATAVAAALYFRGHRGR